MTTIIASRSSAALAVAALISFGAAAPSLADEPKLVLSTPADGDVNVSTDLGKLEFRFSQPMSTASYSVMEVRDATLPPLEKVEAPWESSTTFVLKLGQMKPNTTYAVQLNSDTTTGFQSADGKTLAPKRIAFRTGGSSADATGATSLPRLVQSNPPDGARNVPTDVGRIELVFDQPMQTGTVSVTAAAAGAAPPFASKDQPQTFWRDPVTYVLPVAGLAPNTDYAIQLNGAGYNGFQSAGDAALPATTVSFRTGAR